MPLSASNRALVLSLASEAHRVIQAAQGLFHIYINDHKFELVVEGYQWHPIAGDSGIQLRALRPSEWPPDAQPHTDYFRTRGPQGARQPRLCLTSTARIEILSGSVLYWKQSDNEDPEAKPYYKRYFKGDTLIIQAHEIYGFVAAEDFENQVAFSPPIMVHE